MVLPEGASAPYTAGPTARRAGGSVKSRASFRFGVAPVDGVRVVRGCWMPVLRVSFLAPASRVFLRASVVLLLGCSLRVCRRCDASLSLSLSPPLLLASCNVVCAVTRCPAMQQEVIDTFRRNALAKNLEEEIGQDRLVLVEGRSRR